MLITLAWRNIWRNKVRSRVVIGAIALGIWAAVFMSSFATGMVKSYIKNSVENVVSHAQIHHVQFKDDFEPKLTVPNVGAVTERIASHPEVKAIATRAVTSAMLSTPRATRGTMVQAVYAEQEAQISALDDKISEGHYFSDKGKNQVLIGDNLAKKLNLTLRNKIVLTFQNKDRDITSGAFRIAGIFNKGYTLADEEMVYIQMKDYERLVEWPDSLPHAPIHQVAVLLESVEALPTLMDTVKDVHPDLLVESYKQISPDLDLYESQIRFVSIIYLVVIMLALIFGIINTMLMAVLERVRELGMLMAIGMNKTKVFFMIMLETWFLGVVAAPLGMLLGVVTIKTLGKTGINLTAFSETLEDFGMAQIVYPELPNLVYVQVAVAITITAILASIYPAYKAIRLKPVEAIRKI